MGSSQINPAGLVGCQANWISYVRLLSFGSVGSQFWVPVRSVWLGELVLCQASWVLVSSSINTVRLGQTWLAGWLNSVRFAYLDRSSPVFPGPTITQGHFIYCTFHKFLFYSEEEKTSLDRLTTLLNKIWFSATGALPSVLLVSAVLIFAVW